ncbi:AfsR/SARP family transcriptional regulator [Saccharothrix syringae]|uniref:Tetratricopeptide repeat protein n=1 Tax=Saccharothrix syringae TaxID=103733 RepID=A0A5Q0GYZ5_SACSY|nr:BTAD domain-containing putative transcriptional regulator [Saccharothrix syringae]QFZ19179.1 tetratricopeptide repeat protein [Saccharothrix syringae]
MGALLSVLGDVEVRCGAHRVPVGHARQRSVLGALAVDADRVVPVDALLDRVWGGRDPHRARSALRTYLSRLRQALASTGLTITRQGSGYLLATGTGEVDLRRFERLVGAARAEADPRSALALADEALALWRGEPLAGLDTPWAGAVRERLRLEHAAALADRTDWALACGRHHALLPELIARTAADPLDERAAGQLMLALHRGDRQAEALTHYERLRRRLAEDLGTDPSPALRELHRRILTADTADTADTDRADHADAFPVPRQLPPAPAHFTGRADELAALTAAVDVPRHQAAVTVIAGAGGMGKTSLALHWAHRNADRFPGGQLFVDLQGFSPTAAPVDPAAAVRGFLDALGVDQRSVPADPDARTALFRSLVADRRVLVVLDNARDSAQVAPLLPGTGSCAVLVTSRNRLPGLVATTGADYLALDVLTTPEALRALRDRLGARRIAAEPCAVAELAALCAGHPLALGIAAGRAATQPRLPLSALVAELRETRLDVLEGDELGAGLRTVFATSLRALAPGDVALFGLLALAPGPDIGLAAAAALHGNPGVRTALRRLEGAHLVTQHVPGRYRLHDLARLVGAEHATAHLPGDERRAALRRLDDHYLHSAFRADRLLNPYRPSTALDPPAPGGEPVEPADHAAAMRWFHAEHACLLAACARAEAEGGHATTWRYAWTTTTFHHRSGRVHDLHSTWSKALAAARQWGSADAVRVAHRLFGSACTFIGLHSEAVEHIARSLALAEGVGDRPDLANGHYALANARLRTADPREVAPALDSATRAAELCRDLGEDLWAANSELLVAQCLALLGDHDRARARGEAVLATHEAGARSHDIACAHDTLGHVAQLAGDHERAVAHYERAVAGYGSVDSRLDRADALERLGAVYRALGRSDQAVRTWRAALGVYRAQHLVADARRVRTLLGDQLVST